MQVIPYLPNDYSMILLSLKGILFPSTFPNPLLYINLFTVDNEGYLKNINILNTHMQQLLKLFLTCLE